MKNFFNDVIDVHKTDKLNRHFDFNKNAFLLLKAMFKQYSSDCICFNAGDIDGFEGMKIFSELCRLPYRTCFISFDCHDDQIFFNRFGFLCNSRANGEFEAILFIEKSDEIAICGFVEFLKDNFNILDGDHDLIRTLFGALLVFLSALNCSNIKRVEHKPSEKLQRARQKRGKQPLFSTWTLEIDLNRSSEKRQHHGGTHASPRVHLRRGHPRQYAPGKYTWVQPCAVGNKSLGMINKDYKVTA